MPNILKRFFPQMSQDIVALPIESAEEIPTAMDLVNDIKKNMEMFEREFGPDFSGRLDKILKHAKPKKEVKEFMGQDINNYKSKDEVMSKASESYDDLVFKANKLYKEFFPHSKKLLESQFEQHSLLRDAFLRLDTILEDLKPFIKKDGSMSMSNDSLELMNRMNEAYLDLIEIVKAIKMSVEESFDRMEDFIIQNKELSESK